MEEQQSLADVSGRRGTGEAKTAEPSVRRSPGLPAGSRELCAWVESNDLKDTYLKLEQLAEHSSNLVFLIFGTVPDAGYEDDLVLDAAPDVQEENGVNRQPSRSLATRHASQMPKRPEKWSSDSGDLAGEGGLHLESRSGSWSAVALFWLTATFASQVQVILLPQSLK
ncbi:hypothetical protein AAY473_006652 [Plecturocebus cupreus]